MTSSSQQAHVTLDDVESILLELSRDEEEMNNQNSLITDEESFQSFRNSENPSSDDIVIIDNNSSESSSPIHMKEDVVSQISTEQVSIAPSVVGSTSSSSTSPMDDTTSPDIMHRDTSAIISAEDTVKCATVVVQDDFKSPPKNSVDEDVNREEEDDDIVIVAKVTSSQQQQEADESEKVDNDIADASDDVDTKEQQKDDVDEDDLGDVNENYCAVVFDVDKEVQDYEMVQYEVSDDKEDAVSNENTDEEYVFAETDRVEHQEFIIEDEDVLISNTHNIQESEALQSGTTELNTSHQNSNAPQSVDPYDTPSDDDVAITSDDIIDSVMKSPEKEEEGKEEIFQEDPSLIIPNQEDADKDKEDFEIDSFSERGSNYGDRPKLFDDSIPISSTFVENDSFSEYVMDDVIPGLTGPESKSNQPSLLLEHLINPNTANDSIVTESCGPNESMSTTINETLNETTTTSARRSRRAKTPTRRSSFPTRRMVTRSATKKITEESVTSETTMDLIEEHIDESKQENSLLHTEPLSESTFALDSSLQQPFTKSLRASTRKKITQEKSTDLPPLTQTKPPVVNKKTRGGAKSASKQSPSRTRRATKAETLISMPLVKEEEDENEAKDSLTKVSERTQVEISTTATTTSSTTNEQMALRTRRRSAARLDSSKEINETSILNNSSTTATTRQTRKTHKNNR